MHVSWGNPAWITRDEVDDDAVEKERELLARQAAAEGKPDNVVERIVEGKINSWYTDNVLYDQKFVNAEKFDGHRGRPRRPTGSQDGGEHLGAAGAHGWPSATRRANVTDRPRRVVLKLSGEAFADPERRIRDRPRDRAARGGRDRRRPCDRSADRGRGWWWQHLPRCLVRPPRAWTPHLPTTWACWPR